MTELARVAPGHPPARWEVRVPGSKSITNRALLLAGVAEGRSTLIDPLVADDTLAMADALRTLGATIEEQHDADGGVRWEVGGLGGPPSGDAEVYCGMGATVGRFLVPMLAAGHGQFRRRRAPAAAPPPARPRARRAEGTGRRDHGRGVPADDRRTRPGRG